MATWSRTERTVTTVSYSVPTGVYGAAWNQVSNAMDAAVKELSGTLDWRTPPADDAIRVQAMDDAIVISFERPHGNCMLVHPEPSS